MSFLLRAYRLLMSDAILFLVVFMVIITITLSLFMRACTISTKAMLKACQMIKKACSYQRKTNFTINKVLKLMNYQIRSGLVYYKMVAFQWTERSLLLKIWLYTLVAEPYMYLTSTRKNGSWAQQRLVINMKISIIAHVNLVEHVIKLSKRNLNRLQTNQILMKL